MVKYSISCCFSKLTSPSDLENPGRLPVSEILEGTINWVSISVIFPFLAFYMSRKLFVVVSQSYSVWVTSKIQVSFRYCRNLRELKIGSLVYFLNFFIPFVFEVKKSIFRSFTKFPCLGELENPGQLPILQILQGTDDQVSYVFSQFLHSLRLRGQGSVTIRHDTLR